MSRALKSLPVYLAFFLIIVLLFAMKTNYFVDEIWSYGLANNDDSHIMLVESGKTYEDPEEPFLAIVHESGTYAWQGVILFYGAEKDQETGGYCWIIRQELGSLALVKQIRRDFRRVCNLFDTFKLCHKLFINVKTARGINDNHIVAVLFSMLNACLSDLNGGYLGTHRENGDSYRLADDLKLINCGSIEVENNATLKMAGSYAVEAKSQLKVLYTCDTAGVVTRATVSGMDPECLTVIAQTAGDDAVIREAIGYVQSLTKNVGSFAIRFAGNTVLSSDLELPGNSDPVILANAVLTVPEGMTLTELMGFIGVGDAKLEGNILTLGPQTSAILK